MKQFMKYSAVGVAGYLVGFYEMKYKVVKAMAQGFVEKEQEDSKKRKRGGGLMGLFLFVLTELSHWTNYISRSDPT